MQSAPRPLANGIRTDHPIPDLPFVEDSHLDLDDPDRLAALGRKRGAGSWGRHDPCPDGGWAAYTTDPLRNELAWCVRWTPDHGRSVVLYRDGEAADAHTAWVGPPVLFRSGGYWWDGQQWFRPQQVWDRSTEAYVRREVPGAASVSAAQHLASGDGDASRVELAEVAVVDPGVALVGRWQDHLALWASRRPDDASLTESVVALIAPELAGDQLVSVAQMAEIASIAASTLRAYLARGEGDVPASQAMVGSRAMWARPVAEEWAEQRWRSTDTAVRAISPEAGESPVAPGMADLTSRLSRTFFAALWDRPAIRKRWATRWRAEATVREVADELGWLAAANLDQFIPTRDLAITVRMAVLEEFRQGQANTLSVADLGRDLGVTGLDRDMGFYGLRPQLTRTLDWLIRHVPTTADALIGDLTGEARRVLGIPADVVKRSLATALVLDGQLDDAAYEAYLDRLFP